MWGSILVFVSRYGIRAVKWAWDNKWKLLSLGQGVWDFIRSVWG